jgi:hypothetical protein
MRTILTLFILTISLISYGQTKSNQQTHVPAAKTLVGIWRQTTVMLNNGNSVKALTGNYKVINADGTYYTFVTWPEKTTIGHYGSYEIKSDSLLVEHIINHSMNPNLNGTDQLSKFKQIDENTIEMAWSIDNINWINERWERLPLSI